MGINPVTTPPLIALHAGYPVLCLIQWMLKLLTRATAALWTWWSSTSPKTSHRLLSVLRGCRTKVTSYNSTMEKQIQAKFNSTAGPQAITKSIIGPASCCSLAEHPVVHYANTDTSKMQVTIEVEQGVQLDL